MYRLRLGEHICLNLKKVAGMIAAQHPALKINYYRKPGAYRPAPTALLDQVASECDAALVGIGD